MGNVMLQFLIPALGPILDKLIPDANERAEVTREIEAAAAAADKTQADLNTKQADSPSLFVAGARPAALWLAVIGFGYVVILQPLATWFLQLFGVVAGLPNIPAPPLLNADAIHALLFGLLGLGGLRTVEKVKDVARSSWGQK
jgi:hypothetical protein